MKESEFDKDDHTRPKVFTLAGYNSQPEVKADITNKIRDLGGELVESAAWNTRVTHVIAANYGQYLEKVMAGLVSGAWVLTRRYIEASHTKGSWANTRAFICDDLVLDHRKRRHELGGLFEGIKAVFVLNNQIQSKVYTRILRAGGGEVLPFTSLRQLLDNIEELGDDVNLVIIEDDTHPDWREWSQTVKDKRETGKWGNLRHVQYKFIFTSITKCNLVSLTDFLILESEKDIENQKREHVNEGPTLPVKRFKRDPLVIDLETDSDEDDIEILQQKLMERRKTNNPRIYIEKNYNGPVIDLDSSDDDRERDSDSVNELSGGISLGLRQAISALQPQRHPIRRLKEKGVDDSGDDIEIVETVRGSATQAAKKPSLFQSRLKQLQREEVCEDLGSDSSQDESLPEPDVRPHSPEVPLHVEPITLAPTASLIPEFNANDRRFLKVVDCILERQTITGECLTVGWVTARTIKFDKHEEARLQGRTEFVDSSVREEFYQKYLEREANDATSLKIQLNKASNILSSLRFLSDYTSNSVHPTPAILNNLMVDCVLRQDSPIISDRALDYLDLCLARHLSSLSSGIMERSSWVSTILSSCRPANKTNFDSFDLNNKQDTAMCVVFFQGILRDLSRNKSPGAAALLEFITDLCQKDLQILWRQQKNTAANSWPVIFYLLGDNPSGVSQFVKKNVITLYTSCLRLSDTSLMRTVRRLVTLCAMLFASMDAVNKQSYINSGVKMELASSLARGLHTWHREAGDERRLWLELSLLQPGWLAMLASRHLTSLASGSKLTSVAEITASMSSLTLDTASHVVTCHEALLYRTISTCHLHTMIRSTWAADQGDRSGLGVFSLMSRMEKVKMKDKEEERKVVRFRSGVSIKLPPITQDLATIAEYVQKGSIQSVSESFIMALLFRMTSPCVY